jgi:nickel-dependent lactate racemase
MQNIQVPQLLWYGNTMLNLQFPSEWRVHYCPMKGHARQRIGPDGIKEALRNPIGSKTIGQMARQKKEAVILFDDTSRPTRAAEIVPCIIEELNADGISNDHIRFVCALGGHGTSSRIDFVKKLGEDIVEEFPVYNHNAFSNLTDLGMTKLGTPVQINSEVMGCDLKIGLGSVVPHPGSGFGGGAKIILPGVASIESMAHNHGKVGGISMSTFFGVDSTSEKLSVGWGKVEANPMRSDQEEAARMASLDIKVDAVINGYGETSDVFVGDFVDEHRAAAKIARGVYATETVNNADIVVSNAYAKASDATLATQSSVIGLKENGTLVVIVNAPEGQVTHYLVGKFGKKSGGPLYAPYLPKYSRMIVFSQYKVKDPLTPIGEQESVIWTSEWSEVIELLKSTHPGKPTVAVYPYADMQVDEKLL